MYNMLMGIKKLLRKVFPKKIKRKCLHCDKPLTIAYEDRKLVHMHPHCQEIINRINESERHIHLDLNRDVVFASAVSDWKSI